MLIAPLLHKKFPPLQLGTVSIWPPVMVAPMAGITDVAFRQLCHEFGSSLCVSEMVSANLLVAGNSTTHQMVRFFPEERIRSVQLYTTRPEALAAAVHILREEYGVHHIDLNFGCPMPKITRKGGGAALPLHRRRFPALLEAAVGAAGNVPVTLKIRLGLDEQLQYFPSVVALAREVGIAGVTLHARTVAQFYGENARWDAICRAVEEARGLPIIGNGDVWTAEHARQLLWQTGCQGVAIGRAILGRPFLLKHIQALFQGEALPQYPTLREVATIARRHLELMLRYYPEIVAVRRFRKHLKWYFQGFTIGEHRLPHLLQIPYANELDAQLRAITEAEPYPLTTIWAPRGKSGRIPRLVLPESYRQQLLSGEFAVTDEAGSGG